MLLYNDAGHEVDADLKELLAKSGGQIVIGKKEGLLDDVEEVILSPGISMENPLVQEALNRGINVTGEAIITGILWALPAPTAKQQLLF